MTFDDTSETSNQDGKETQSMASHLLSPDGDLIQGYRLICRLGGGGFGEVWKAVGPGGVDVALKILPVENSAGESKALEFMKHIRHPHLLSVLGIWERESLLVVGMELADGTLSDLLATKVKPIPFDELDHLLQDVAEAIDFLNSPQHTIAGKLHQRIFHRDIKPQNLLVVGGQVKVADYGLARSFDGTKSQMSLGFTPAYAAPECATGKIGRNTDQYALAITYCELRAGRLPFCGSPNQMLLDHIARPPDLTMLPEYERDIVAKAFAKQSQARWPNCMELIRALRDANSVKHRPQPSVRHRQSSPAFSSIDIPNRYDLAGLPTKSVSCLLVRTMSRAQRHESFPSFLSDIELAVDLARRFADGEPIGTREPATLAERFRTAAESVADDIIWYDSTMAAKDLCMFVGSAVLSQEEGVFYAARALGRLCKGPTESDDSWRRLCLHLDHQLLNALHDREHPIAMAGSSNDGPLGDLCPLTFEDWKNGLDGNPTPTSLVAAHLERMLPRSNDGE